jgi:V/A-type H+/Na+-transporting ATPase subunit I
MIVPMKKFSFLVYHREYEKFLLDLQDLGVLHIIQKESGELEDEELRKKYKITQQLKDSINFLEKRGIEENDEQGSKDATRVLAELDEMLHNKEQYLQKLSVLKKELNLIEPWGEFQWDIIENLRKKNIRTRFFTSSIGKFEEEIKDKYYAEPINQIGGNIYFVLIELTEENSDIDAEEIQLPDKTLGKIQGDIEKVQEILEKTEKLFDKYAAKYLKLLQDTRTRLINELSFEKVILNTQKEAKDKLMILEGWVPDDKADELVKYLNSSGVYFEISKPDISEAPPIKLKNNKFARLYEVIGELYTFPDYQELDLTPFFAPFYMLFFGFCLGDLGYGLIITLGAIYGIFKVQPKLKPLLKLGMYLGIATTIMGGVGGTAFGINLIDTGYTLNSHSIEMLNPILPAETESKIISLQDVHYQKKDDFVKGLESVLAPKELKSYKSEIIRHAASDYTFLNSFRYLLLDSNSLMALALLLGYIQVLFGMFIKAANKARMYGFKHAISQLGWNVIVMIAIPAFGLGYADIIDKNVGNKIFLIAGIVGGIPALFYNSPGKNPFLNLGVGLWDTYQTASGLLGDVLSYIRLFALGISSAILGNVFNTLALTLSPDIVVVRQVVIVLILLFGHGLNFFMAALGSFVHPLRLTFVEFYKNAGFVGGGKKYEPFRK